MKKIFFILTLITAFGCDYRKYPQEQEWREDVQEPVNEMKQQKDEDPRKFDKEQAIEQEQREVNVNEINFTPANN